MLLPAAMGTGLAGAVYLALIAIDSRPIADDWGFLGASAHLSSGGYLAHYWNTASDRFSSFVLVLAAVRIFGDAAVNVVPLVLLASLWAFATVVMWHGFSEAARLGTAAVGLLAVVAVGASGPSLYDSLGWLNSTGFYLAGFTSAAGLVCWCLWVRETTSFGRRAAVWLSFVAAAICAGFTELVGTMLVLASPLALLCVRDLAGRSRRSVEMFTVAGAGVGAAVGTAVNLLGPGTGMRESVQHAHVSLAAVARTAGHNLSFIYGDAHSGVLLLAVAAGALAWRLGIEAGRQRSRRWLSAWSAFLLVVPWLVTSALTAWGGSVESNDRSPFRAAFLITSSVSVAVVVLTVVVLSQVPGLRERTASAAAVIVLGAGGLLAVAHKATPTIRAETKRVAAVDSRADSVRRQLKSHRTMVILEPAPLLTVYTQAYDLSFLDSSKQAPWIIEFLRSYYDIPPRDRVRVIARQPRNYCLAGVAAPWVGVQSCQELHARR